MRHWGDKITCANYNDYIYIIYIEEKSASVHVAGCYSSVVEHFLGKEEVTSSILVNSSLRREMIKINN